MKQALKDPRHIFELGLFIPFALAHQLIGVALGQVVHANLVPWYAGLVKPPLTPPSWVYGLAWSALYLVMAYCLARVWARRPVNTGKKAIFCGILQLFVNMAWVVVFFGYHRMLAGALTLAGLFVLVCLTAFLYGRVDRLCGVLFIPYILWLGFAAYLTIGLLWLNP